jgi:hypothetical protein
VKRWAVAWKWPLDEWPRSREGKLTWCFTFRNRKPDPDARTDRTMCGSTVVFRVGSEKRTRPTCPDCLAKMREARA